MSNPHDFHHCVPSWCDKHPSPAWPNLAPLGSYSAVPTSSPCPWCQGSDVQCVVSTKPEGLLTHELYQAVCSSCGARGPVRELMQRQNEYGRQQAIKSALSLWERS